jgi:hypothetical protein
MFRTGPDCEAGLTAQATEDSQLDEKKYRESRMSKSEQQAQAAAS